jgi:hypothetical protein
MNTGDSSFVDRIDGATISIFDSSDLGFALWSATFDGALVNYTFIPIIQWNPTGEPTSEPSEQPSSQPSTTPSCSPTATPTNFVDVQILAICDFIQATNISNVTENIWSCESGQSVEPCAVGNVWPGLTCSDHNLDSIRLMNVPIGGTIPESLGLISTLSYLELNGVQMSGESTLLL